MIPNRVNSVYLIVDETTDLRGLSFAVFISYNYLDCKLNYCWSRDVANLWTINDTC